MTRMRRHALQRGRGPCPWLLFAATLLSGSPSSQEPPAAAEPPARRWAGGAAPSEDAVRLGSPPALAEGLTEEEMWPAATAEGWRQPCLVRWQRTFADAQRVARAQRRPILVAVNMDGEIASEHFAGVRYRQPETAALMGRYVCVIASVYRHTPRDYDEEGRRVECPRFGTVTCGEHVEAARELADPYFDDRPVAPRHIVIDLDGRERYDVYFAWDTATVFTTFRKGVEGWPDPIESGEPTLSGLARSADVQDRQAIERIYREGDRETRRAVLVSLAEERVVDQVEVLREAIFGYDLELSRLARRALARCETEGALDLMAEALKMPLAAGERELLLDAVARLAQTSPRARTLASLHGGLSLDSRHVGSAAGDQAAEPEESPGPPVDVQALAEGVEAQPADPAALLELAGGLLNEGQESADRRYAGLLFEDALAAAGRAEQLGAGGPRLDGLVAVAAAELGRRTTARERAVAALEGGLLRLEEDAAESGQDDESMSGVSRAWLLRLFGEARQLAIREAFRAGEAWPPEWLSDVIAASEYLMREGYADEAFLVDHHDFLRWIGATQRANAALDDALLRFPNAPVLHDRLRARLLWEGGPEGLERGYSALLGRDGAPGSEAPQLSWYAGYGSLIAAEHHRRRGDFEAATAAYGRAIALFERGIEEFPETADNARHYVVLALAGRARVALELGDFEAATGSMVDALVLRPDSAGTPDGLNVTPVATAKMLQARLREAGDAPRLARLQQALEGLDPSLLEPPPFERLGPRGRRGAPGQRR